MDNAALKWVKTMEPKGAILECWLTMLSEYEFDVKHRAGTKDTNADALSQGGLSEPADPKEDADDSKPLSAMCIVLQPEMHQCMRTAQEEDKAFATVQGWVGHP